MKLLTSVHTDKQWCSGLFVAIYHYMMPPEKSKESIVLEKKAISIYKEHGCLAVEISRNA